jgi:hypothetical protein
MGSEAESARISCAVSGALRFAFCIKVEPMMGVVGPRRQEIHSPRWSRLLNRKQNGLPKQNMRRSDRTQAQASGRKFLNPQTSQRLAPPVPLKNEGPQASPARFRFHSFTVFLYAASCAAE